MIQITIPEVEQIAFVIARKLLTFNQPIPDFNTRPAHKLESCLATPFQTFDGKDLYPSYLQKVSVMFYLMNKNHPLVNGNKRVAVTTLLYSLHKVNKWINVDNYRLYRFAVWVADSPRDAKNQVVEYVEQFIRDNLTVES